MYGIKPSNIGITIYIRDNIYSLFTSDIIFLYIVNLYTYCNTMLLIEYLKTHYNITVSIVVIFYVVYLQL